MKKHLAILCGVYYPHPSPTGQCVDRFIELLKDTYTIDVISLSESDNEERVVREDGVRVFTLCGRRLAAERRGKGAVAKLLHLLGGIEIKTRFLGNLTWFRHKAARLLTELHAEYPYDTVFSVCSPLAAHAAAVDFKRLAPTARHVAYTVDPYATAMRPRPIGWSLRRLKAAEKEILSKADAVLASEEMLAAREDVRELAKPLPYVLPEPILPIKKQERSTIDCVYAGRFYEDIRHPEPMLRCFSQMSDPRIRLHLYTTGCEEIVSRYAKENPSIVRHELLPHKEILRVYAQADVLVNIGNRAAEFLPSKTFEYIATGKPILHFKNGGECCFRLKKYPLVLQLNQAESQLSEAFIRETAGRLLTYDEICEIYREHTKDAIKEQLLNALKGH